MKVYLQGSVSNHRIFVSPGADHPEKPEWIDANKKPLLFEVIFKHGVAEVEDRLGQYLCDKEFAHKSRIITKAKKIIEGLHS